MKYLTKRSWVLPFALFALSPALLFLAGCEKESTSRPKEQPTATAPANALYVNTRCPIMGTPIDPGNVPADLTREFKGQKIAFCCGGCPAQWDKLSDKEKEAKLQEAISKK